MQAVVTSSDLQFDHTEVYFGCCSIYQSVKSSVHLTNLSLLPQEFGFVGVPEVLHRNLYDFSSVVLLRPYFVINVTIFVECGCLDPVLSRSSVRTKTTIASYTMLTLGQLAFYCAQARLHEAQGKPSTRLYGYWSPQITITHSAL